LAASLIFNKNQKIMKKAVRRISYLGVVMFTLCFSFNTFAGWDYKSEVGFDRIDGRSYVVIHCEDKLGDDCNMVGSATRIDYSIIEQILGAIR
jgi:hypothetical protein